MSAEHISVMTPAGDALIRADTAAEMGIAPHARLTWPLYQAAAFADHQRNREDRRREA